MAADTRKCGKALKRVLLRVIYVCALTMVRRFRLYLFFRRDPGIRQVHDGMAISHQRKILCVFASFSIQNRVAGYAEYYLKKLCKAGCDIVFVSTSTEITRQDLTTLRDLCLTVVHRENHGLDFGSWKAGLLYSGVEWQKYEKIIFVNDSCYAPMYSLQELLQKDGRGIVSITDSLEQEPHLMSYFLLCHQDVIRHPDFLKFWQNVRMVPTRLKGLIVQLYEIGFSRYFRKRGFDLKAVYPIAEIGHELGLSSAEIRKTNPTHRLWRFLIETKKCPVLKVDLFKRDFKTNNDDSWRKVVSATNYDIRLILEHQGFTE